MNISELIHHTSKQLQSKFGERTAKSVSKTIVTHFMQWDAKDLILKENQTAQATLVTQTSSAVERLKNGEPLQYVINEAWFYGNPFYVDSSVLIPRPETEELVDWIVKEHQQVSGLAILDVGTGSGCIPISLAKHLIAPLVYAIDKSEAAVNVALKNNQQLKAGIHVLKGDALSEATWGALSAFDLIVSNPPYIPESESSLMTDEVLHHEPEMALFVPNEDPLLFYRVIANFAMKQLKKGGKLYFECNEFNADKVEQLLIDLKYTSVALRKDMQGKNRMIRAVAAFV